MFKQKIYIVKITLTRLTLLQYFHIVNFALIDLDIDQQITTKVISFKNLQLMQWNYKKE